LNFSWFFASKIAFGKNNKNNVSRLIILIGQVAVALGLVVSIITISTGIGARKAIKQKLSNFNGHILLTDYNNSNVYVNFPISTQQKFYPKFPNENIEHIQPFATLGGVIRTHKNFEGIVLKGYNYRYNKKYLTPFLVSGRLPNFYKDKFSEEVLLSKKIADNLELKLGDSFIVYFIRENKKPIYRRLKIVGTYQTNIKDFDDSFVIGDIKHIQKINQWEQEKVSGFELFTNDIENINPIKEQVNVNIGYAYYSETVIDKYSHITDWIKLFDTNVAVILSIMLLVVAINIIMVLLILIVDRTNSIGLLKTMGSTNTQIQKLFIYYGISIILPGLFFGNLIGLSLVYFQEYFKIISLNPESYYLSDVPSYVHWSYLLALNLGSILICAIVLFVPSLLIRKISPVDALKYK
jgi:lipoprotein-releasing system permease protein